MDEFLIDKNSNRTNTLLKNPRAMERLRKNYKETLKQKMVDKVEKLEETRVYIITHMSSLSSYHKAMIVLKSENARLKADYERVVADINRRVSETLTKNEESDDLIKKLQREKTQQRRKLSKDYAKFLESSTQEIHGLEKRRDSCKAAYDAQVQELIDLREFKVAMTFLDPEVIAKRITAEKERMSQQAAEYEAIVTQFNERFEIEKQEAEQTVIDRIIEIIEEAKMQLSSFINKATAIAYKENKRLKSEIELQLKHQELLKGQLRKTQIIRKRLLDDKAKHVDDRRRVLNLKACMTCTPDMDASLPSKPVTDSRSSTTNRDSISQSQNTSISTSQNHTLGMVPVVSTQ
eukprot:jgi/Hompol1/4844/HPOL_003938-RA